MDKANHNTVGIIGLGIMGSAIADQLISKGFSVKGIDPNPKARAVALKSGVDCVSSVADLVSQSALLLSSLPSVESFETVCEALIRAAPSASEQNSVVLAETSTLPIEVKQKQQRRLSRMGIQMLDCPLSGTGAQARVGDLAIYASGPAKAIKRMMPVFEAFTRSQVDVGKFGNGMRMKLVANLLVAIHNVAAAEAILLGKRLGLDPAELVRVVGDGAGTSRMFQVRGPVMASRSWEEATMKVSVWQKDMAIIGEALSKTCTPAPLFAASAPIYLAAKALGFGEQDTAAVMAVLERMAGDEE